MVINDYAAVSEGEKMAVVCTGIRGFNGLKGIQDPGV